MDAAEKVKEELLYKAPQPSVLLVDGLSSGLTVLNLALTGDPNVAFFPGHCYLLVGASRAGKTWLLLQTFAEASISQKYRKYRYYLDQPEKGALMDVSYFFGERVAKRLRPPGGGDSSRTIEELYDNVDDAVKDGRPFIYGVDSLDALSSEAEIKKAQANKKARRKSVRKESEDDSEGEGGGDGEAMQVKGSYGDGKAKVNSAGLRVAHNALEDTDPPSMLFTISQARDNPAAGPFGKKQTRSGGRALTFYASIELWFSIVGKIKKTIKKRERTIGSILRITVEKNRVAGWEGYVDVPFYRSYGMDDIGANINYLIQEKHWKGSKETVTAPEFDFSGKKDGLARHIEENESEQELKMLTARVWREIESACRVKRKRRYE